MISTIRAPRVELPERIARLNDLAYNLKRGGAARLYIDGVLSGAYDLNLLFDPTSNAINMATAGVTQVVIEVDCWKTFTYGSKIGFAVMGGWRAKDIKVENYDIASSAWITPSTGTATNYTSGEFQTNASLTAGAAQGFNKLRFTFSNFNSSSFRMGQLFVINYSSPLGSGPFLARDGGALYGDLNSGGYNITANRLYASQAPASASELARKDYVDTQRDTRVAIGTGINRAYTRDGTGVEGMHPFASTATAFSLMYRTTGGVTSVGTPTAADHAATKAYVDGAVSAITGAAYSEAYIAGSTVVTSSNNVAVQAGLTAVTTHATHTFATDGITVPAGTYDVTCDAFWNVGNGTYWRAPGVYDQTNYYVTEGIVAERSTAQTQTYRITVGASTKLSMCFLTGTTTSATRTLAAGNGTRIKIRKV